MNEWMWIAWLLGMAASQTLPESVSRYLAPIFFGR